MIKNSYRTKEFNRERRKYDFAHLYDDSDHSPRGKIVKNRIKYPKQNLIEELENTFQNT